MMAQLLGWVFVLVVAAALVRALAKGVIEFDPGGHAYISASRATDPVAFWTIFFFGVLAEGYFLWLLLS